MYHKMRRFKQELPENEVCEILHSGKVGIWAVAGDDDYPYAVPVNYVYDGKAVYIHCAMQGHKLDAIRRNPKCSMCIVDKDDVIPEKFTTCFRSVILFGKAYVVNDEKERLDALLKLSEKYSPGIDPEDEINRFIKVVCVVRIDIDSVTGKEAIELTRMRSK